MRAWPPPGGDLPGPWLGRREGLQAMADYSWEIEWSGALSMSNPQIDAEHRRFVDLVNELNGEILNQRRDKAVVERILALILEEAVAHFEHEERLLVEKGYPEADKHAQAHAELAGRIRQALKEIHSTEPGTAWIETGLRIKVLLVDHLLNDDTKYIDYLRSDRSP